MDCPNSLYQNTKLKKRIILNTAYDSNALDYESYFLYALLLVVFGGVWTPS